jgi:uncharacterized damage-inducible protein DinB
MPNHPKRPANRRKQANGASLESLQNLLNEAYTGPAWHGPTLSRSVRGVSAGQAEWRPGRGRHSIREVVVHAAYWKHVVRCRLLGQRRPAFPLAGRNWFTLPPNRSWRDDLRLLAEAHDALLETVAAYPAGALNRIVDANGQTAAFSIRGIAAHDVYHAGQIQLLRAMM